MTSAEVSALLSAEFAKPCEVAHDPCGGNAEWATWSVHSTRTCEEVTLFTCGVYKVIAEELWIDALTCGQCECGHVYAGQVSDYFRAIRL